MGPDLIGRVAVVTGAARGGGRGIAATLARHVEQLVLVGRSTDAEPNPLLSGTLEDVALELRESKATIHTVRADLSQSADCEALVRYVNAHCGGCDLLVNNAAFNPVGSFLVRTQGSWEAALAVNVTAPAMLSRALAPNMIDNQFGRIVNIGSAAAITDFDNQLAYAVSKAALERLTVGLAFELAHTAVAVNCIRVDEALRTQALSTLMPGADTGVGGCTPAEFGDAVAWLLARDRTFTGQVLTFSDLRERGALPGVTAHVRSPTRHRSPGRYEVE